MVEKKRDNHAETSYVGATPVQVFSSPAVRAESENDGRLRLGRPQRQVSELSNQPLIEGLQDQSLSPPTSLSESVTKTRQTE